MQLRRSIFLQAATAALLLAACGAGRAESAVVDAASLAALYRGQVDMRLEVPPDEIRRYARLAEEALWKAGTEISQPQYLAVVDRDPRVQAILLLWRAGPDQYQWIGASPVATGRPGSFEHFKTPLGVFEHSLANPDFRAEGTRNANGIRGYGEKGMRVFDFGWQRMPKGWGDGAVSDMRLQMHATDPELLERRLGSAQSKGCIRIPATLNRLLDHYGVLDADYEQEAREGRNGWLLDPRRQPVAGAGRYLLVVESGRSARPAWSPSPFPLQRKPPPSPPPRS